MQDATEVMVEQPSLQISGFADVPCRAIAGSFQDVYAGQVWKLQAMRLRVNGFKHFALIERRDHACVNTTT